MRVWPDTCGAVSAPAVPGLTVTELGPADAASETEAHEPEVTRRDRDNRDHLVRVIEAVLLGLAAFLAAYSGYAAAKWNTESRLDLARAAAASTEATRANLDAFTNRNFDASTFNAWFAASVAHNQHAMNLAAKRFSSRFRVAFNAWERTDPARNPNAPPGPTYMPQYQQPDLARANKLDAQADSQYLAGSKDGTNGNDYVRVTFYLATVLFLVAISGHFRLRRARNGLITVSVIVLIAGIATLATLPRPPT
jgi:hypothetical protein